MNADIADASRTTRFQSQARSPTGGNPGVVMITSVPTPDGDVIVPIVINGVPKAGGQFITAHIAASAHGRENAWTGLVREALSTESAGGVGVFYLDTAKASKAFARLAQSDPLLAGTGLKYARDRQAGGTVRRITDPGSPVKVQAALVGDQTKTLHSAHSANRLRSLR